MKRQTRDPVEIEANKVENMSTTNDDHYEKYDVEAIEIDTGLTGGDTADSYGDGTDEDIGLYDKKDENDEEEEGDEDEEIDKDQHEEDRSPSNYWNTHPKDLSTARWTLFKGIEMLAQRFVASFLLISI